MSLPHYDSPTGNKVNINIQKFSRGFTSGVSYSISNVINGSAVLSSDTVGFTPNAAGLCSFNFTVTDSEGGTMTRKVNIVSGYSTLKVDEITKEATESFKVWPVPSNGYFSVLMENDLEKADLKIYDIYRKRTFKTNN